MPITIAVGGKSPPYLQHAARTVQRGIAGAQLRVLPGQTHQVGAKPIAALLSERFS